MKHLPGHIKLVIFDVDGTLVTTKSGETFRKTADDWQWLPGRIETLQALHEQGVEIALATNQGGVAFGYMTARAIADELNQMAKEAPISDIEVCFTHPKATIAEYRYDRDRRKPGPGMLMTIMYDMQIGPIHTLMVGDRPEDEQAAQAAGVAFQWSDKFFSS
jgi:D-glycero-D-manno-heptose 1,7-bisphosphate phosphatase